MVALPYTLALSEFRKLLLILFDDFFWSEE